MLERLAELLYPPRCAFCHNLTPHGVTVCEHCRRTLPFTGNAALSRPGAPLSLCAAPLYYEGKVRESLHRYKFASLSGYAKIYGEFLSKCIDENRISCDIITWVPLSRRRLLLRGYDQARLLAEDLSRRTGLPCRRLLRRVRHARAQSLTGGAEARRANIRGAYRANAPEELSGKRILVVDDIVTTGVTLTECARTLRSAGAAEVLGIAVARSRT